jgi:predicted TIM-barrel fold metal-dependent hydrolase
MPQIVYQSYWITKTNIERLDDDHKRMNFVSVKLHQCWEDFHIDDEYFKRAALWASRNQIPLFIHIYSREEMLKLIEYIRSNPESIIVIGHLYCLEDFLDLPKEMLSNVFFDLSNYYFVSKERFLMGYQAFGAEHFLLGSDTPYGKNALEKTVGMVRDSGIAESDINKICGKNAVDLFHL